MLADTASQSPRLNASLALRMISALASDIIRRVSRSESEIGRCQPCQPGALSTFRVNFPELPVPRV